MDDLGNPASGLLWAFRFEDGRPHALHAPALDQTPAKGVWTWAHFPLGDTRARTYLSHVADAPAAFHELIEDGDDRIQIRQQGGWAYGVLPDLERDLEGQPRAAGRLMFAFDAHRLITARLHALRVVDDVRRQVERGERLPTPLAATAAFVERYAEVLESRFERLAARLDVVEDEVLSEPSDLGGLRLGPFRRELALHRRELQGLRNALSRACGFREPRGGGALAEALAPLIGPIEDLDREAGALQERARLLHEEIDTLITSATNRSMRALTVISTLLIPPTLITGAFGMNLSGIPFGHSPFGFALAAGVCLTVVAAAVVMLRRMGLLP